MSKYEPLWNYIKNQTVFPLKLTFDEIEKILCFPISHTLLNCKNELYEYGYKIIKISLKEKYIDFGKL